MYVLEDLGFRCRDGGLNFAMSTHMVSTVVPIARFGSEELKRRYLPRVCDGSIIGAHAITEPEAGSDVTAMRTSATADGTCFVLNGRKSFVSNGPVADLITVYARIGDTTGAFGISAFVVDRQTDGLIVGPPIEKLGLRSSPFCEIHLQGCRVPKGNLVGIQGMGFIILTHVMTWEILCSFAIVLGEMRNRLERCINQAKTRVQSGQPIGKHQAIANKLVDMKIGVETSSKWLYDTAEKLERNVNVTTDVAITKLVVSEANVASALAAMQIFGGRGYTSEYGIEADLRNAVAGTIYSGTSEIQRLRVATMLGL
jgi:alkylation response protein AidB-like acyl-CoA dehydrogenase